MKRTIDQWKNCDPKVMAHAQSDAAKQFAFEDAKADILALHAENERVQGLLAFAIAEMAAMRACATPDEECENAIVPSSSLRRFVDAHAHLMYESRKSA